MPVEDRGGVSTHWLRYGQGPRQAMLLHCSLAHSGAWQPLAACLGDRLSMTAFDMPGHGRSGDWEAGDIQAACVAMAVDLIEGETGDGPVDFIGHSFGGTVGLRLAAERPDLVRSLVAIEPVFMAVARADHPEGQAAEEARLDGFRQAAEAGDMRRAAREFMASWGLGDAWDDLSETAKQRRTRAMRAITTGEPAIYEDTAGLLAPGGLESVERPVLLVEGALSPDPIRWVNEGLARRLPDASRAVIEGADHMAPLTHPEAVAARIAEFLGGVPV